MKQFTNDLEQYGRRARGVYPYNDISVEIKIINDVKFSFKFDLSIVLKF